MFLAFIILQERFLNFNYTIRQRRGAIYETKRRD